MRDIEQKAIVKTRIFNVPLPRTWGPLQDLGVQENKQNSESQSPVIINHICRNPVKRIRFLKKALYTNVTKSPSIKSLGPISLLFPDIKHNYNLCL